MKRLLLTMLERLGYVLIHADVWRSVRHQGGVARAPADPAPADDASPSQTMRAQTQIQALERQCGHLKSELKASQDRLAAADTAGRIKTLEEENRRLSQRAADLEVYLKETRGPGRPSYL